MSKKFLLEKRDFFIRRKRLCSGIYETVNYSTNVASTLLKVLLRLNMSRSLCERSVSQILSERHILTFMLTVCSVFNHSLLTSNCVNNGCAGTLINQ